MKKTITVVSLSAMLLALSFSVHAQQPGKIHRIGFLSGAFPSPSHWTERLPTELRALGYVEGKNIAIESRFAEGKSDRRPVLADELVRLKVEVFVAGGTNDARAAKNATKAIPIVMVGLGGDPVEAGVIESLARPGGNVTGITNLGTDLGGKRLELLKEAVPKVSRVAVLYDPAGSGMREVKETLPVAAGALGLTVRSWEVRDADGFEKVFAALRKDRPDGLYVAGGPVTGVNGKRIAEFALKSRLPAVYGDRGLAIEAGGLMYYGADLADIYRRVAYYVDRILKGAKPADLPVEQPTKFELVINLKTAKQIGLTIPQSMLYRADKVIK